MLIKDVYYFNNQLEQQRMFEFEMDERYVKMDWVSDSRGLFILYQKRMLKNDLAVMHLEPNGTFNTYQIPLVETIDVRHFHVFGNNALIGGIFEWKPTFWLYEMDTKRLIALQGVYQPNVRLIQSIVDKKNNIISILTSNGHLITI